MDTGRPVFFLYPPSVLQDPRTASVRVGILSYNNDPDLARHYLIDLSVPCGFIRLKLGLKESARILLTVLEANEARGQQKQVRTAVPPNAKVSFNVRSGRELYRRLFRSVTTLMTCN